MFRCGLVRELMSYSVLKDRLIGSAQAEGSEHAGAGLTAHLHSNCTERLILVPDVGGPLCCQCLADLLLSGRLTDDLNPTAA